MKPAAQIDVVFDLYFQSYIKNDERDRRPIQRITTQAKLFTLFGATSKVATIGSALKITMNEEKILLIDFNKGKLKETMLDKAHNFLILCLSPRATFCCI